jgi:predicted phage tail protein
MSAKTKRQSKKHLIPVIRVLNPFNPADQERSQIVWSGKKTLADYFPVVEQHPVILSVSGRIVQPEQFAVTYLDKTDNIVLCPVPTGGGNGKSVLAMVAMIAVAVAAPQIALAMNGTLGMVTATAAGALTTTGMMVTAGITMAGSLLVNAIFAPPKPTTTVGSTSASYGVDGAKNTSLEGIPVPVPYGQFRMGGNIIGTYTTTDADDNQTLYMLLSAGEGPINSITDIEINDNPLTDYHDVEIQTRLGLGTQAPINWFTDTITPVNKGQKLTTDWFYSTTTGNVDQLRLDFTAPSGLCEVDSKSGSSKTYTVGIDIEYRAVGDASWSSLPVQSDIAVWNYATRNNGQWYGPNGQIGAGRAREYLDDSGAVIDNGDGTYSGRYPTYSTNISISAAKRSAVRRSYTTDKLTTGAYEVRVRRTTAKSTKDNVIDDVYLTDVNEITLDTISYPYTALVALKIKMTDQLSGIPTVTFLNGGRMISTYDGSAWSVAASNNPAWIVWDILTHTRYGGSMPTARLDLVAFKNCADYCTAQGLTWNGVMDTESNVWDACQVVLRVGHSQMVPSGTRYTIITEKPDMPVMMFSVANMIKGTYKETWLGTQDRANEIDVTYFDRTDKYKQRTLKVYDPIAFSSGAPQRNSAITLYGVVDTARAYKEAQFQLNLNRYILKTISFGAPLEAIACRVGDLIYVQTDLTDWAQAGRFNAGSTTSVMKLDRPVTMASGKTYNMLAMRDSVQRGSGSVISVVGNSVTLGGFSQGPSVKRIIVGGKDIGIDGTFSNGVIVQDATGIAPGQTYVLWDTDVIDEYPVVVVAGTSDTITLQTPMDAAPAQFTKWMFGEATRVKQQFRVKSITGNSEYRRDITAIEYRPEVYDYSRYGSNAAIPTDSRLPIGPVDHLSVYEETYIAGDSIVTSVVASWTASTTGMYAGADVWVEMNGEPAKLVASVKSRTSATISAARGDVLKVRVVAVDVFDKRSKYEDAPTATYTVIGETPGIDVGRPSGADFVWAGRDCKINWRYNSTTHSYEFGSEPNGADAGSLDPHFKDYQITVYGSDGKTVRRVEYTTDNSYVYIYDKNFADGLSRKLTFEIRQRDIFNNLGKPAILDAYNPAPVITSNGVTPSFESASFSYAHSDDADFAGVRLWMSQNAADLAGTPADTYLKYSGPDTSFVVPGLIFGTTYYYKMAAVDAFGPTDLVVGALQNFTTTTLNVAAIADGVLGDSKLLPTLKSRIDLVDGPESMVGSVNARIKTLSDQFNSNGATSTAAAINSINDVSATSDSANARTLYQLKAQVNDAQTGLPAATAAITQLNTVSATSTSAAAQAIYQLSTRLNNIGGLTMEQKFSANANTLTGLSGQYTVKIDNNGYIAGFGLSSSSSTADGNTSQFVIYADKFGLIMPSYPSVQPFTVGTVNGVPRVILSNALIGDASIATAMIGDAQINSLKIAGEAVTVPISVSCYKAFAGAGIGNYMVITEGYFNMTDPGILYALFTGAATFPTGDKQWRMRMRINGQIMQEIGGAKFNDAPSLSSSCAVPAGVSHVEVLWYADTNRVQILTSTLFMMATKK